ncbi:hypothetical protein RAVI111496_07010 [Rahnella victoriana]|nr:Uncharacterised protein [Campylobacter jejuni]
MMFMTLILLGGDALKRLAFSLTGQGRVTVTLAS